MMISGVVIDESVEKIKVGDGKIVPGWEKGILGACEEEERRIIVGSNLAFGDTGVVRLVPPKVG